MPINYLKKIQLGEFNAEGYRISPSLAVASVIEGFYVFSRDPSDGTHLIFNDGYPVLVFLENSSDTVTVTAGNEISQIKGAWAGAGPTKNVYVRYNDEATRVFIVRFHTGAFKHLFGLSAAYFRKHPITPFERLAEEHDFGIHDFFGVSSIEEKIKFVEQYVQHSLASVDKPESLHQTLEYIHQKKGNGSVRALSADTGVNYKWLERSFLEHVGLLPKEYIQLQRFLHAYLELVGSEDVDLMRIAISNGYYDANHFLKDFKVYTGKTPLGYLKFQSGFRSGVAS